MGAMDSLYCTPCINSIACFKNCDKDKVRRLGNAPEALGLMRYCVYVRSTEGNHVDDASFVSHGHTLFKMMDSFPDFQLDSSRSQQIINGHHLGKISLCSYQFFMSSAHLKKS